MTTTTADRLSTGIEGLDEVLDGGLIPGRAYMLTGDPGTGKTLVALEYLSAGVEDGETSLFINLEETTDDVRANAAAAGVDAEGIEFLDLSPGADVFVEDRSYDVFTVAEAEGTDVVEEIVDRIDETNPDRVVVDPLSQLRDLVPDDYQFRKHVRGFVRYLEAAGATILFTSQSTAARPDDDLGYLSDGTIRLTRGRHGRSASVPKFRGSATQSGDHALRITDDGVVVYPVLTPGTRGADPDLETVPSGVPAIDSLLHGGIERGTITILSGPSGVGKTTLGTQFVKEAAGRGERSVVYTFEENLSTFVTRSEAVNIPVESMRDRGTLVLEEVEPLQRSPEEFAAAVRHQVEERDASIVMIDGIDGYRLSLRGEDADLRRELTSLGRYLKNQGVTAIFVDAVDTVTGDFQPTNAGVSYLADNIVFLRYLERQGELAKAIGILKKRTSDFERTLREFSITEHGIAVGEPLTGLQGILGGSPEMVDEWPDGRSPGGSGEGA